MVLNLGAYLVKLSKREMERPRAQERERKRERELKTRKFDIFRDSPTNLYKDETR